MSSIFTPMMLIASSKTTSNTRLRYLADFTFLLWLFTAHIFIDRTFAFLGFSLIAYTSEYTNDYVVTNLNAAFQCMVGGDAENKQCLELTLMTASLTFSLKGITPIANKESLMDNRLALLIRAKLLEKLNCVRWDIELMGTWLEHYAI